MDQEVEIISAETRKERIKNLIINNFSIYFSYFIVIWILYLSRI